MDLEQVLQKLNALAPAAKASVVAETMAATKHLKWIPNPGPQTDAYFSKADLLLFGGEPGGGKTGLCVGLAFNCHEHALIMRRQYTDLSGVIDQAKIVHGSDDGFNGSPPPKLVHDKGRIDFGACSKPGDEQQWMGRPHDLLAFDEATQFNRNQVRFMRGWVRSTRPGQRCRTVLATNPPLSADGLWVLEMFAPWLNPQHPNPAKPGELRWFVVDDNDKDIEVEGSGQYDVGAKDGALRDAESRTFIPSKLDDNPYLRDTDYKKQIDALPAEIREILLGGFRASFRDQPMQLIPTAWIRAAQARWTEKPPEGVPQCAIGVDCSGGGTDPMILAPRYDGYYPKPTRIEGTSIPAERIGRHSAGLVVSHRSHDSKVIVDMGGGYGGAVYETLCENIGAANVVRYLGAEKSVQRTKDGKVRFTNIRTQTLWRFREALDPAQEGGSPIALPDDPELVADLTAPTYELTPNGYKAESKEDVCTRLGRSTDKGDAVIMSWSSGDRAISHASIWHEEMHGGKRRAATKVNYGPRRPHGMARR